jgi:hypothetical protein
MIERVAPALRGDRDLGACVASGPGVALVLEKPEA